MSETLEEKIKKLVDELEEVLNDMEVEDNPTDYNQGYYNAISDCIEYLNQRLYGKVSIFDSGPKFRVRVD